MELEIKNSLETFLENEILTLYFKQSIIKKASKNFNLPKEEVAQHYQIVRKKIKKIARNKAWTFLLLGSISFGVGLSSIFSNSAFILYTFLFSGAGLLISALGYFKLSFG